MTQQFFRHFLGAIALGLLVIGHAGLVDAAEDPSPIKQDASFGERVQGDFIKGFGGDQQAFDRAMKACDEAIAANPQNAEALVWRGSALLAKAGQFFQAGNFQQGGELWKQGHAEMDRAVSLAPENPDVLIVRGSTLLQASRFLPAPDQAAAMLEKGLGDFELALKVLSPSFDALPVDVRGRLLIGLADGWQRSGDAAKTKTYCDRAIAECKGTRYEQAAKAILAR